MTTRYSSACGFYSATEIRGGRDRSAEIQSILVDLDRSARSQPALAVASALAGRCGALVRVVDTGAAADSVARPVRLAPDARFGSGVPGGPAWREPHEVLLGQVEQSGYDLVVRSQEQDRVAGAGAGVNRRLFRLCPCPVWAVGVRPVLQSPTVVAAVNVMSQDPLTARLNDRAVRFAALIADLLDGELIVLHAWRHPAEERFRGLLGPPQLAACLQNVAGVAGEAVRQLVDGCGPLGRRCRVELRHGSAEEVIPRFVVAEGADIVVAGARGERGIWPLLFNGTAERLLKETSCSVVAVKA